MILFNLASCMSVFWYFRRCEPKEKDRQAPREPSYWALRLTRVFFCFVAVWQVIGMFPLLGWIDHFELVTLDMWFRVVIKVIAGVVALLICHIIRRIINHRHNKRFGKAKLVYWNDI